jgi:hypothetical protein
MKLPFTVVIALGVVLSGVSPAHAESDPFPGIEHMGEIPGTRISSPAFSQQAEWEATATYQNYLAQDCPEGSGRAIAVDVAVMVWSNYCVKTWRSQAVIQAWEKFYSDEAEGRANAYEQSLAWNKANPGKQRCFSYGPLTSPDGGTTSGGVCANPIPSQEGSNLDEFNENISSDYENLFGRNGSSPGSDPLFDEAGTLITADSGDSTPAVAVHLLASLPRG